MTIKEAANILNAKLNNALHWMQDFISVCIVQSDTEEYIIVFTSNPLSKKLDFIRNNDWYGFHVQIKKMNQPKILSQAIKLEKNKVPGI